MKNLKKWKIALIAIALISVIASFCAVAHAWSWPGWGGGGSTQEYSVNHIDIWPDLSADVYINDEIKNVEFSIDTSDAKYVQITANPSDTNFTISKITTSVENNGEKQVRFEGKFPVGTKDNPVYYTVTLSKEIEIEDGVTVPITLSTTLYYWDSANLCPAGPNKHANSVGIYDTPNSGMSGIDLHLSDDTVQDSGKGKVVLQKNINGVAPKFDLVFNYKFIKPDGKAYMSNIKLVIPANKTFGVTVVPNVDYGEYTVEEELETIIPSDSELSSNEFESGNKILMNSANRGGVTMNMSATYKEACNHEIVTEPEKEATCTEDGWYEWEWCWTCNEIITEQAIIPALGHNMVTDNAVAPTCTKTGLTEGSHCSRCDHKIEQEPIRELGHNMGEWHVTKQPTCAANGEERSDCSRCEHYEVRPLTMTGHTEVVDNSIAPTCTDTGLTEGKHCEVCDQVLISQSVIPALGHNLAADVAADPDCTNTGLTSGEHCTRCDYKVEQQIVNALGHDMGKWYVSEKPTCTVDGEERRDCLRDGCEHFETRIVAMLPHAEVIDKAIIETCTTDGLTEGKHCDTCGVVLVAQKTIPMSGHDIIVDAEKMPTCMDTGLTVGEHCSRCDYEVKQNIVLANGHTMSNWYIVNDATCIANGLEKTECAYCDHFETNTLTMLGHDMVIDEAVAPTCTSTGLTNGSHCSRCEHKIDQEVVDSLGHDMCEWYVTKQPTCTEDGKERTDCSRCEHYEVRTLIMTGHKVTIDFAISSTCTTTGLTAGSHCSVCDTVIVKQEVIPTLGHNMSNWYISITPTCTSNGQEKSDCHRCDYFETKNITTLGHDMVVDAAVAPTCMETGLTEGSHCSRCDHKVAQEAIDALDHDMGEWYMSVRPTCTTDGEERSDCHRCNHFDVRILTMTGHTEVVDPDVNPTCTDAGLTEGKHCSICNGVIIAQKEIPVLGHVEITVNTKMPDCVNSGYTGDITCDRCHATLKVGSVIQSLGHDMGEYYIYKNATCIENGIEKADCKRDKCAHYLTRDIVATGHNEKILPSVDPTCEKTGLTEGKICTTCDAVLKQQTVVDSLGHILGEEITIVCPTCEDAGENKKSCIRENCDYFEIIIIHPNGHGQEILPAVSATCTKTGLTEGLKCPVCDAVLVTQDIVLELGHNIVVDSAVTPDCINTGLTKGEHCSRCDYKIRQEEIEPLGHNMGNWYVTIHPTCTVDGAEQCDCQRCDYFESRPLSMTGHSVIIDNKVDPTCITDGLTDGTHCDVCNTVLTPQDIVPSLGHDIIIDQAIAPDCVNTGLTPGEHCTRCDHKVNQEIIPANGHVSKTVNGFDPDCLNAGLSDGEICEICAIIITEQTTIPALGHDLVVDAAVAPTCLISGLTEGKHCTRCNYIVIQKAVSALGHDMGNWHITAEPTYTTEGERMRECERENCDYVEIEKIPMLEPQLKPQFPLTNGEDPTPPQTGDGVNIWICVFLMTFAILGLVVLICNKKKKE